MIRGRFPLPSGQVEAFADRLAEEEILAWGIVQDRMEGRTCLEGWFTERTEAETAWEELWQEVLKAEGLSGDPAWEEIEDEDWKESYKRHFLPWNFRGLHWAPEWLRGEFAPPRNEPVLWLDPGMAFGTGNQETTRLCMERLVAFHAEVSGSKGGMRVCDAGCGSGILALSAALLGFGDVVGFDNDAEAIEISIENARRNSLEGRVRWFTAALEDGLSPGSTDFLMANIQADVLRQNAPGLISSLVPGGTLVLSGILAEELGDLKKDFALASPGAQADSRILGEWADLWLRLPPNPTS